MLRLPTANLPGASAFALTPAGALARSPASTSSVSSSALSLRCRGSALRTASSLAASCFRTLALGACSISLWHIAHLPSVSLIGEMVDLLRLPTPAVTSA